MAWNTPLTFVNGTKHLAAALNAGIRDDLLALSTWTNYTPTWTNVTLGTSPVNVGQYSQAGKIVTVRFRLVLGAGGSFTGVPEPTLPFPIATLTGFHSLGTIVMDDTTGGATARRVGVVTQSNNNIRFFGGDGTGTQAVAAAVPFTWAAGDTLAGTFIYEAA